MTEEFDTVIVHYGEIGLKGRNRPMFERALIKNIKLSLKGLNYGSVSKISGRIIIKINKSDIGKMKTAIENVIGIENFSFGYEVKQEIGAINARALSHLKGKKFNSFRVTARRSEKSFKLTSQQINEKTGEYIRTKLKKTVNLSSPDMTVHIEIVDKRAFVFFEKIQALGGLPVGVSGNVVSMISSGIDSPVAAFKSMKRGLNVIFAHFHSYPYTNKASINKAIRLVKLLTRYQNQSLLYIIPFSEIQNEIVSKCPQSLRVLLYRRLMIRISEEIAKKNNAKALVTGESVGQVASQTLDNIFAIDSIATMPMFRPLIGDDKKDIITAAQELGTYSISIEPHDDCCSLFLPKSPETHAKVTVLDKAEKSLDIAGLVKEALEKSEVRKISI